MEEDVSKGLKKTVLSLVGISNYVKDIYDKVSTTIVSAINEAKVAAEAAKTAAENIKLPDDIAKEHVYDEKLSELDTRVSGIKTSIDSGLVHIDVTPQKYTQTIRPPEDKLGISSVSVAAVESDVVVYRDTENSLDYADDSNPNAPYYDIQFEGRKHAYRQYTKNIDGEVVTDVYKCCVCCEYPIDANTIDLSLINADAYYLSDGSFYEYNAIHKWNDINDGKANRYICYYYVSDAATFFITGNTPLRIFVMGKLDSIKYGVSGGIRDIIIPDESEVRTIIPNGFTQNYYNLVLKNIVTASGLPTSGKDALIYNTEPQHVEISFKGDIEYLPVQDFGSILNSTSKTIKIRSIVIKNGRKISCNSNYYSGKLLYAHSSSVLGSLILEKVELMTGTTFGGYDGFHIINLCCPALKEINCNPIGTCGRNVLTVSNISFPVIESGTIICQSSSAVHSVLGCKGQPNQVITYGVQNANTTLEDIEIGDKEYIDKGLVPRWKPKQSIVLQNFNGLTAKNIALHILSRLDDNSDGELINITIGATNLQRILDDLTYSSYVQEARDKGYTIS